MIASEHEQLLSQPVQGVSQNQGEADQNIVKRVNELFMRAKRHRRKFDQDWQYNYEFVISGRQWPAERPRWRFNEAVNIAWSTIMTEIGIQTDSRPKFEFLSQEPGDESFLDILRTINDRNWERYKWNAVVQHGLFDAKIYHVGHAIVEWNEDLESGLGDVDFRMLDPFYAYWDPLAEDVNKGKRCRYFIYAEPVPTNKLKDQYPDKADSIKPDLDHLSDRHGATGTSSSNLAKTYINFDPYSPSRLPSAGSPQGERYGGEPMTLLIRCWLRDDTLEQCENDMGPDPVSGEPRKEYVLKKRYPTGRYVEIACNTLLFDGVPGCRIKGEWVPYIDPFCPDNFPIARIVNYDYPREYAGENEITHIKGPQKIVNYVWSYILDSFRMAANPKTIISTASGIDPERLTNEPNLVIETNEMAGYRQEPGAPIAPGSFDLLSQATMFLDKIQGLQDVSRGAEQANVNSGVMLEGYIEAAQTRPRLKNRNLDCFLQDVGQLVCARYLQFYDSPRTFRTTNKEGYPEYIEFYMPQMENGEKVAKLVRMKTDGSGQIISQTSEIVSVKGVPDIRVTSGSSLPYAKAQKAQTALQYFTAGAIDGEELLKAIDWPNWQDVLKRIEQKAAAQQQGAPPPSSPPSTSAPGSS